MENKEIDSKKTEGESSEDKDDNPHTFPSETLEHATQTDSQNKSIFQRLISNDEEKSTQQQNEATISSPNKEKSRFIQHLDIVVFKIARAALFGIIAGVVGVITAILLLQFQVFTPPSGVTALEFDSTNTKISTVEESLQNLNDRIDQVAEINGQVVLLKVEVDQLIGELEKSVAVAANLDAKIQDASARISITEENQSGIREELSALYSLAEGQVQNATIENLLNQFAALESMVASIQPVEGSNSTESVDGAPNIGELITRLLEIEKRIILIEGLQAEMSVQYSENNYSSTIEELASRIASLEASDKENFDFSDVISRIESIENSFDDFALLGETNEGQIRQFSLLGIRSAIESGAPYLGMLSSSEIPLTEFPEVVLMHADTGVDTLEYLRSDFAGYAREVLSSPQANPDSQGLFSSLSRLFKIRPLSPQEGEQPAAILSRSEDYLARGNLGAAASELASLSDQGQEIMADWLGAVEARLSVLGALDSMLKSTSVN